MGANRGTECKAGFAFKSVDKPLIDGHILRHGTAAEHADVPTGCSGINIGSRHDLRIITQGIGKPELDIMAVNTHGRVGCKSNPVKRGVNGPFQPVAKIKRQAVVHRNAHASAELGRQRNAQIIPAPPVEFVLAVDKGRANATAHINRADAQIDVFPKIGEEVNGFRIATNVNKATGGKRAILVVLVALIGQLAFEAQAVTNRTSHGCANAEPVLQTHVIDIVAVVCVATRNIAAAKNADVRICPENILQGITGPGRWR